MVTITPQEIQLELFVVETLRYGTCRERLGGHICDWNGV